MEKSYQGFKVLEKTVMDDMDMDFLRTRAMAITFFNKKNKIKIFPFQMGFTLIELLIVIAIIAILAGFAIPYYRGYIIRARLVEVEHAMSVVKDAVSNYRLEKESVWPNCPTINEIRNSLGVGLTAVTRVSSLSVNGDTGVITATVDNIHPMVNGKTITLTPTPSPSGDGSFSWRWGWSDDFPMQYRPKAPR